jgi:hypothetical protein
MDLKCFDEIHISNPVITNHSISSTYKLKIGKRVKQFNLKFRYSESIIIDNVERLARMIITMPVINYGLFTESIFLEFEIDKNDLKYLYDMLEITATDVFVNKLCRRRANFIKEEYLPTQADIKIENAHNRAKIYCGISNLQENYKVDANKVAVLSSGGKESLLTYGLLKEIGAEVYPLFFNESGGHWRTAVTAYRQFINFEKNTKKVWSNIDRFYLFMLDNMKIIRPDHRDVRADTYPIRLFIFGPYIFSFLPILLKYKIGNVLLGSEYDDPRVEGVYQNIPHRFGIYDQSEEFDEYMTDYFFKKGFNIMQWSAVRPLYGLVVVRILSNRYPELFKLQRSCHSCHIENGEIVPCGECTKCLGVLSFVIANGKDPKIINYKDEHIQNFEKKINNTKLRLDDDEREQVFYILNKMGYHIKGTLNEHVEKLHFDNKNSKFTHIPEIYRDKLFKIYKEYTKGAVFLYSNEFKEFIF